MDRSPPSPSGSSAPNSPSAASRHFAHPTPRKRPLSGKCLELADRASKEASKGNLRHALALFLSAIDVAPESDETYLLYFNTSTIRSRLEMYKEALADADRVVALEPACLAGYIRRGHALEDLFMFEEALACFQDGLKVEPTHSRLRKECARLMALVSDIKAFQVVESQVEGESESKTPLTVETDCDRVRALCAWLQTQGACFSKMFVKYYTDQSHGTHRGSHVKTRVGRDEILIFVPSHCIITSEVAKQSIIGKEITQSGVQLRSSHSYIASFLLQEKHTVLSGGSSPWRLYLDVLLNIDTSTIPLFFSTDMLAHLKGSMMIPKIEERHQSLRSEFRDLQRAVPRFRSFQLEEFVWARMAVVTRIYGLHIGDVKTDGLVPLACMLNHDSGNASWGMSAARGGFIIRSTSVIDKGDSITVSYGRKCNSRFFLNYGFVLDENHESNEAMITLTLPKSDPLFVQKAKMIISFVSETYSIASMHTFFFQAGLSENTLKVFSFARLLAADQSELAFFPKDFAQTLMCEPISVRNEMAALAVLREAAVAALREFDTTILEDSQLLESYYALSQSHDSSDDDHFHTDSSSSTPRETTNTTTTGSDIRSHPLNNVNIRNCVVMRLGEKRVLHWLVDLCDVAASSFSLPWITLKKAMHRWETKGERCRQVLVDAVDSQLKGLLPVDAVQLVADYAVPDIDFHSSICQYIHQTIFPLRASSQSNRAHPPMPHSRRRDDSLQDDTDTCSCFPRRARRPQASPPSGSLSKPGLHRSSSDPEEFTKRTHRRVSSAESHRIFDPH